MDRAHLKRLQISSKEHCGDTLTQSLLQQPPAAVNAPFNLASNCLDSHWGRVWVGGVEKIGGGLRLRPQPEAPREFPSQRQNKRLFCWRNPSFNWITAECRETVAFQATVGSCFIIVINTLVFFSLTWLSNQCSAEESAVSFGNLLDCSGRLQIVLLVVFVFHFFTLWRKIFGNRCDCTYLLLIIIFMEWKAGKSDKNYEVMVLRRRDRSRVDLTLKWWTQQFFQILFSFSASQRWRWSQRFWHQNRWDQVSERL